MILRYAFIRGLGGYPTGNEVKGSELPGSHTTRAGWEGKGKAGGTHFELAQHRVAALPQVGQIQTPLVILESLEKENRNVTGPGQAQAHTAPCMRFPALAHQQVFHFAHGLVDMVEDLTAALSRLLHLLPFRGFFCKSKEWPTSEPSHPGSSWPGEGVQGVP